MAWLKIEDFARTSLQVAVSDSDTSMTVLDGERLPDEGPMLLTLWDGFGYSSPVEAWEAGELEVVRCTGRAGDVLAVERGDGAAGWDAGTVVALTVNAEVVEEIQDAVDGHTHDGVGHGGLINVGDLTGWDDYDGFTLRGDTIVSRGAANRLDIGTAGAPDSLRVWGELQIGSDAKLVGDSATSIGAGAGVSLWSDAAVEMARVQFVETVKNTVDESDLRGLWIPSGRSGSVIRDWSGHGRDGTVGATQPHCVGGLCRAQVVGASDRTWSIPAAAWQSFGNGVTDSPFAVVSLVRPTVAAITAPLIGKQNNQAGLSEYRLWWTINNLFFRVFDQSTGGWRGRAKDSALVGDTWQVIVATYDGSADSAGCRIYINGTRADTADSNSGSYTAMSATAAPFGPIITGSGGEGVFLRGCLGFTLLIGADLTSTQLDTITDAAMAYGGVS